MSAATILAASPGRLRAAAGRLASSASGASSQSAGIQSASSAVASSWSGLAADMFRSHCERLSADARTAGNALGRASEALSALAGRLEYAQQLARESQSLAASAASMRAHIATMEPSPMIRQYTDEAYAASSRSAALEAEADRIAREAAAQAASVLREVASAAPSRRDAAWAAVLNLGAGDLGGYMRMRVGGLPPGAQALIGRELAQMLAAATEGEWDEAEMAAIFSVLDEYGWDGDFTSAFFNEYGGRATAALVEQLQVRYGAFTPESERFTEPLSSALGIASRSGSLDAGVVDALFDEASYEGPMLLAFAQLIEHGTFSDAFSLRLGDYVVREIALNPTVIGNHTAGPDGAQIDLNSVILHAVARNEDASRTLLLKQLDEPSTFGYVDYLDVLMSADFMGPDSGVGALIKAATLNVSPEDMDAATRIAFNFITRAPEFEATHNLHTDVVRAAGSVAAEYWDHFADVAYATTTGAEWTKEGFAGEITGNGRIHISMDQAIAFLEIAVSDDVGRAELERAVLAHRDQTIAKALDMEAGDARDHVMHRMGASLELFSIADSMRLEVEGIDEDTVREIERKVAGLLLEPLLGKTGPLGLPLGLAFDAVLDDAFHSEEHARGVKAGSLSDIRMRLEYKLEVIDQAVERGLVPRDELKALLRFMAMQGASEFDGIRHVTRLMDTQGLEQLMNNLRDKYLYDGIDPEEG